MHTRKSRHATQQSIDIMHVVIFEELEWDRSSASAAVRGVNKAAAPQKRGHENRARAPLRRSAQQNLTKKNPA